MRNAIIEITIFVAIFVLGWLKTRWDALFYIGLALLLMYAFGMVYYLFAKWSKLSWGDRFMGLFAMAGWLVVAWAIIHEKGLTVFRL